ncbi:hypothetical protein KJ966_20410 [bacterium]|nr:hypothetical protein [bacterium]
MATKQETANKNLANLIALCCEMLELADLGDNYRVDDGCGVVFGSLRDSAYKIRRLAKEELLKHDSRRETKSRNRQSKPKTYCDLSTKIESIQSE